MLALLLLVAAAQAAPPIDLPRLLTEMTDRSALARYPDPPYRAHLVSSGRVPYSVDPEEAVLDVVRFRATACALHEGERALLDTDGPGVITRIWSRDPSGSVRVYVDDAALAPTLDSSRPVLDVDMRAFLDGRGGVASPLAGASTSYLPIPFARRVLVTVQNPGDLQYVVEWRRYSDTTDVESFAHGDLARHAAAIAVAGTAWRQIAEPPGEDSFAFHLSRAAPEGELLAQRAELSGGPRAVSELRLRIDAADPARALRTCVLRMTFDGEQTVAVPLGAFFGVPDELRVIRTWFQSVSENGELVARFVMPYREKFDVRIDNAGDPDLHISGRVRTIPWTWDERSLHFHASWRSARGIEPDAPDLVKHARVQGRGVFVGEWLAIANPTSNWWGRGDERITVDGQVTHWDTGAISTFGLSTPATFQPPLHGEARRDGPLHFGRTDLYRFRALDAVPFEREFDCAQENRRAGRELLDRAACAVYYARPGAQDDAPPVPADPSALLPKLRVQVFPDAIEAETATIADAGPTLHTRLEARADLDWSGGLQLACSTDEDATHVEFEVPAQPGRRTITVRATRAPEYSPLRFTVDGREIDTTFDPRTGDRGAIAEIALGEHQVGASFRLRVMLEPRSPSDRTTREFGLDAFVVR